MQNAESAAYEASDRCIRLLVVGPEARPQLSTRGQLATVNTNSETDLPSNRHKIHSGSDTEDFAKQPTDCQNWRVGACTEMGDFLRQYGICSALNQGELNNKQRILFMQEPAEKSRKRNQKLIVVCVHARATDNILASIKAHH